MPAATRHLNSRNRRPQALTPAFLQRKTVLLSAPYTSEYGGNPNYGPPKVNFGWIGEAWEIYKKAWLVWLLLYIGPTIFGGLSLAYTFPSLDVSVSSLQNTLHGNAATPPVTSLGTALVTDFFSLVSIILTIALSCCASDIALRQVRGEVIQSDSIFRGLRNTLQMLLYWLLYYVALLVGELACCIGVTVSMGLLLPGFAMIADGATATQTVTISFERMKGDWFNAALFQLLLGCFVIIGTFCTCDLGGLVLGPMIFIISALAYRDMVGLPGAGSNGSYPVAPGPQSAPPSASDPSVQQ